MEGGGDNASMTERDMGVRGVKKSRKNSMTLQMNAPFKRWFEWVVNLSH